MLTAAGLGDRWPLAGQPAWAVGVQLAGVIGMVLGWLSSVAPYTGAFTGFSSAR